MRANFVCFKLSKIVAILVLIILLQLIFIVIGIKEIFEAKSFEQIQDDIEKLNDINIIRKDKDTPNTVDNSINNETIKTEIKDNEITLEEYKNMPRELKGYKVIRKNSNSKAKIREFHSRRNK